MGNKHVYVNAPEDGGLEDLQFFDSAELLYRDYESRGLVRELTRFEFIQAVEDEEMVEEGGQCWYRDVILSEEQ